MVKKDTNKERALPNWFWTVLGGIIVIIVITAGWIAINRSAWPGYLQALSKCDGRPPVQASSFITSTYITPSDDEYRIPGKKGFTSTYYCTEAEAQAAGYKHLNS